MLPVESAIDVAFNVFKSPTAEAFYRQSAWELIRCFLIASMNLDDDFQKLNHLFFNVR
jgi:transformation/transcription domain-associated protein